MNRHHFSRLFPVVLVAVVGCSSGDKLSYANVSGTVTLNGQPIEKGQITFALEGRPPTTIDIVDGKFAGQAAVGSNKIMVSARKKSGGAAKLPKDAETTIKGYKEWMRGKSDPGTSDFDPTAVEMIPSEWSTDSKQMRVVEAGAKNEFQFDIKGQPKK